MPSRYAENNCFLHAVGDEWKLADFLRNRPPFSEGFSA
jgi:hypothetical protein